MSEAGHGVGAEIARSRGAGLGWLPWAALYLGIAAAWALVVGASAAQGGWPGGAAFLEELCIAAAEADPAALFLMWALMCAAMMVPTVVPALRVYGDLGAAGAASGVGFAGILAGYLAVWLGVAAMGAAAQAALSQAALVTGDGASRSPWLTAGLLALAGAWQLGALKAAALRRCRQPFALFLAHWQPGLGAHAAIGLRLGLDCVACCWALMALGFLGGTMNLAWMAGATLLMTLEKLPALGRPLTRPLGWICLAMAVMVGGRAALSL